ncbi:MAG: DALR anticodon-binding domain-containing protein, partial [Patescibacteria group bacterium]
RDDRMPHKLCQYLYQLCQAYNAFYNVDPILTALSSVRDVRVSLTACTASVLRTGAELLTLRVPDRM